MKHRAFGAPVLGFFFGLIAALFPLTGSISLSGGVVVLCLEMILVLILAGNRIGAQLGAVISGLLLSLPCYVDAPPVARCLLACFCAVPFVAAAALVRFPPIDTIQKRLGYLAGWCGTVKVQRCACNLDVGALMKLIAATVVLAIAIYVVKTASASSALLPVRWLAGGIATFAFAEMASAALPVFGAAFGLMIPPLFRSPHLSASISEFWTKRWNIATSRLLRKYCFEPLARRNVATAVCFTFLFSGVAHILLAYLVLGRWGISLICGMFFFVQPLLIAAERRLNVRRRPVAVARAWTLSALAITSPLIIEPTLQVVESGWYEPNTLLHAILAALLFVLALSLSISLASLMSCPATARDERIIPRRSR